MLVFEFSKSSPENHWANGIPSTITEEGLTGISRNGVVAEICNAPEGAHRGGGRRIGTAPSPPFRPNIPRENAPNPRKNSLRLGMAPPVFCDPFLLLTGNACSEI